MRIKEITFLALCCVIASSCSNRQEPEPRLGDILQIYCSPIEFGASIPLAIYDNSGWEAVYGRPFEKEGIPLKPRCDIDEEGDSIIVFDEYINDKVAGAYQFKRNELESRNHDFVSCQYIKGGEKVINYFATVVRESDLMIRPHNPDMKAALGLIENYQKDYNFDNPGRGVLNLSYLLHNQPEETLKYDMPSKEDGPIYVTTSQDGRLRAYLTYYLIGNGHGAMRYFTALQYKGNKEVMVLDNFDVMYYDKMKEFEGANFPICRHTIPIFQAKLGGQTYYMVELSFDDEMPDSFNESIHNNSMKAEACTIMAFCIKNGKLIPANIIDGKSMIELVANDTSEPLHFKYDDTTKELSIPVIEKNTHNFNGEIRKIKLKEVR